MNNPSGLHLARHRAANPETGELLAKRVVRLLFVLQEQGNFSSLWKIQLEVLQKKLMIVTMVIIIAKNGE
jgi:hypothetical protein